MQFYIYLTINLFNKKGYIGSHKGVENDNYLGSGVLIKKSIKKYGRSNFKRIIIKHYDSIEEARIDEGLYITQYNTLYPHGYNIAPNGGTSNGGHSEYSKKLISEHNKGKHSGITPWKGKTRSEETKIKISNTLQGNISPMKGRHHSTETKQKISINRKGKSGWIGKKHNEITKTKISNTLLGKTQTEEARKKRSDSMKKIWEQRKLNKI